MPTESPLSLVELRKLHPDVKQSTILYVTRKCQPYPGNAEGSGNRRGVNYLPSEVAKRISRLNKALTPDVLEYAVGGRTFIARETIGDKCGVHPDTADRWVREGLVDKPVRRNVKGGRQTNGATAPWYRSFYVKEQIVAARQPCDVPLVARAKPRSPTEIRRLDDNEFITVAEMNSVGVTRGYARAHWDFKDPRRKSAATPAAPIGRIIKTTVGERVSARSHRVTEPLVRWGDIRELLHVRDNPPTPEGGVLVRDAIPRLKSINICVSDSHLISLIQSGVVAGGKVASFKKNFYPATLWWMKWEDRANIPQHERPGTRRYWIDGADWYPSHEAWRYAACRTVDALREWMPQSNGGAGRPCPYLGNKLVRCRLHAVKHKTGERLVVSHGDDVRAIAEGITGHRPVAPKAPPAAPPRIDAAPPAEGNGQAAPKPGGDTQPNDLIAPKEQVRMLGIPDDWRDQVRRLQIVGDVRAKAVRLGFPITVVKRGTSSYVSRQQWQPIAELFGMLLAARGHDVERAKKAIRKLSEPGAGGDVRTSYFCEDPHCMTFFRTSDSRPVCPKCEGQKLRRFAGLPA